MTESDLICLDQDEERSSAVASFSNCMVVGSGDVHARGLWRRSLSGVITVRPSSRLRDSGQERLESRVAPDDNQVGIGHGAGGIDATVQGAAKEVVCLIEGLRGGRRLRRERGD